MTREGRWWIIDVLSIDHRTQARALSEVEYMGRDLIATMEDVEPDSFDVAVQIEKPADVAAQLDEAARLDREAQEAIARAAHDRRAAARRLREVYALSAIDIAALLGVTRGRVYQLLEDREKASV
ncbi:hypothetical protein [Paramicrobacterium agarici]|uniref:Sigma-70-like protein n=1 Tax=Paramicrobacterium agarici TaxID=630514 RepID=A0A2A9DS31_9MICO|nr:hypothetical protein [Microbacterium agarici]PFG29597.1 hypothetical protein ATJ78_0507 [Microbacterium agarici]TQO22621.1 hypothetical protein FB385_1454 [Microbacterium agarici]